MSKKNKNKQQFVQSEELENTPSVEESSVHEDVVEEQVEVSSAEPQDEVDQTVETTVDENENKQEEVVEQTPVAEEVKEPIKSPTKGVLIVEKKNISAAVAEKVVPETVKKFNDLADKYIDIMRKDSLAEADRCKAVAILCAIGQYVVSSSDNRVFDACEMFFRKNRAIMLVSDRVTDGLYKYCDKNKVVKLTQWYVTFQNLVQSKLLNTYFALNTTTIRRTFNNDALANWLILKTR